MSRTDRLRDRIREAYGDKPWDRWLIRKWGKEEGLMTTNHLFSRGYAVSIPGTNLGRLV